MFVGVQGHGQVLHLELAVHVKVQAKLGCRKVFFQCSKLAQNAEGVGE